MSIQINDDTGEQFTFEELRLMTIRAAQNLQKRGYGVKQVVGIISENYAHFAPIVFAALSLGNPVNPVHGAGKSHILSTLQLIEPKLIFCGVEKYDLIVECLAELGLNAKIFTLNGKIGDAETVESLFSQTGTEAEFVYVKCGENL